MKESLNDSKADINYYTYESMSLPKNSICLEINRIIFLQLIFSSTTLSLLKMKIVEI